MTNDYEYIYGERAVAFLDVLGFQSKLLEFEREAVNFKDSHIDEQSEDNGNSFYYSRMANDFIETFNSAISKLNPDKFSYYLFSDNICITANNINSSKEKSLLELLLVISELYFEFVQKGYFLRGGIDYGLFIDKSSIALGTPLAEAYKIETSQSVFPRIVLSNNFVKQFKVYSIDNDGPYYSILIDSLIKKSCEVKYLNVFNHIFKVENKEEFFESYYTNIKENLLKNAESERIYSKYQWLAKEFNAFIDTYTETLAFLDENFEATDEFITSIQQLKISYGN
ncbi:MAG: hypothetical protein A2X18_04630 [Bacteroidetes bacterium GWF2_40_14]|nr:MAG: hypothetical protein A2X18_04630 [Bacteroidetes bacterium GWF2_40_14]